MAKIVPTTGPGEWRGGHWLPPYLTGPERVDISVAFVLGGVHPIPDGLRVYMVVKFRGGKESLDYLPIPPEEYPKQLPFKRKEYYGRCTRWVPFCFVGSFDEQHINWSVSVEEDGSWYERLEFYCSFSVISHDMYFPFTLKALSFRMALDGTGRSGDINLIPLMKKDPDDKSQFCTQSRTNPLYDPDVEYQVFCKPTSVEQLEDINADAFTRMMVRNQTMSGTTGTYTRVYAVLLFQSSWAEEFLKYVGLSGLLLFVIPFCAGADTDLVDTFAVIATLVLTQAALLFILPPSGSFTTTEQVIVFQIISTLCLSVAIGFHTFDADTKNPSMFILACNIAQNAVSCAWVYNAYRKFTALRQDIRNSLGFANQYHLVNFDAVEQLI